LIVTNNGIEIFWFSQCPNYRRKLRELLEIAAGSTLESARDHDLAASLATGFQTLPLVSVACGLARNFLA